MVHRLTLPSVLVVVLFACPSPTSLPGDLVVGNFSFAADAPIESDLEVPDASCGLSAAAPSPFTFEATLTVDRATGRAFLSRAGSSSEAGRMDGRTFAVCGQAQRVFDSACDCGEGRSATATMDEVIAGRVFGASEPEGRVGNCPDPESVPRAPEACAAPDGGEGDAGGASLFSDGGVDAVLVCGQVRDTVRFHLSCGPRNEDAGISCRSCAIVYRLVGHRR